MKRLLENWHQYLGAIEERQKLETDGKNFTLTLPKLRISEQWGTPGSEDRKIIEMFTAQIQGSNLHEKINSLNEFISKCDEACISTKDVSEILGSLVFLDSLAAIIYDFNATTAGFLFEALISALLGSGSSQVPTGGQGIYQDTTDVIDERGRPMSLKFYKLDPDNPKGYITAAVRNLRVSIIKHGQPMIYLLGLKNTKNNKINSVDFYEVSIGSKADDIEGQFDVKDMNIPMKMIVQGEIYTEVEDWKKPDVFHRMPGDAQKDRYFIGSLQFGSREDLIKIAQNYADRLGDVLLEIYEQLDHLTNNINTYFLENKKEFALKAQQNAVILKAETEELV
tara:strand:+ start:142 stop:1155 length:1014 start_codon:yes stop_codon:yes gene_type:complete